MYEKKGRFLWEVAGVTRPNFDPVQKEEEEEEEQQSYWPVREEDKERK